MLFLDHYYSQLILALTDPVGAEVKEFQIQTVFTQKVLGSAFGLYVDEGVFHLEERWDCLSGHFSGAEDEAADPTASMKQAIIQVQNEIGSREIRFTTSNRNERGTPFALTVHAREHIIRRAIEILIELNR